MRHNGSKPRALCTNGLDHGRILPSFMKRADEQTIDLHALERLTSLTGFPVGIEMDRSRPNENSPPLRD